MHGVSGFVDPLGTSPGLSGTRRPRTDYYPFHPSRTSRQRMQLSGDTDERGSTLKRLEENKRDPKAGDDGNKNL